MNSNIVDFSRWENRWQAQKRYLHGLKNSAETSDIPRKTTILSLIQQLEQFGQSQMDFFKQGFVAGFKEGPTTTFLSPEKEYPPDFALSVTIQQIGFDIDAIEKCIGQRSREQALILQKLQLADSLAYQAVEPAIKHTALDAQTTVITYFQKSPNIRVIPYAPVLLVGIPFSCINQPRDFLAIPHEVGHYVFWHGALNKLGNFPTVWCENWYEEIFADIYGALVAGPVIGLDFQELQAARNTKDFFDDDGEHPAPVIRPFIHSNFFAAEGTYKKWGEKLYQEWDAILTQKYAVAEADLQIAPPAENTSRPSAKKRQFKRANGHPLDLDLAITPFAQFPAIADKPMDALIVYMMKEMLPTIPAGAWPSTLEDAKPGSPVDIKNLDIQFEEYLQQVEAALQDGGLPGVKEFDVNAVPHYKPPLLQEIDDLKEKIRKNEATGWLKVLYAAGWATKGPKCEGSSGVC